jgi:hypothetical protein
MTDATAAPRIIARITPPSARRWFAILSVAALGGVLIWLGLAHPPQDTWALLFLLGFGALALYLADRLRQATEGALDLREDGLFDRKGRLLAPAEAILAVNRGVFAFKPSNGFVLVLDRSLGFAWEPGLWWRVGRRVGVGGVITSAEGRFMAEMAETLINRRGGR